VTLLARVVFALLVAATLAAFFVAQRLKSEPAAVNAFRVQRFISPNGDGVKDRQVVRFRVEEADDLTVDVVDRNDVRVARLVTARPATTSAEVRLTWDGRTDVGRRAPDGLYRIRVGLRRQGRSIVVPKAFVVDTTPPSPAVIRTSQSIVTPGQPVDLLIRGAGPRARPRFTVLRTDDGEARAVRRFEGAAGERRARWDGRTDEGTPAPPGTYLVAVGVRDRAGNEGSGPRLPLPDPPVRVEGRPGIVVRGIAVQPPVKPVPAGQLTTFRIDTRGASYRWSVRRVGESRPRKRSRRRNTDTIIAFRAPGGISGTYLLEVRAGRYSAQVPFAVQALQRAPLLVVLPVIGWLGTNQLDDPRSPDGLPNTLTNGAVVPYPRAFAGEDGLPPGFADDIAPLLVLLDRSRIRYDITTDLALSIGREPRAADRPGVLFAGASRWITRPLARRLRRYVQEGGRVAVFGEGGLRASVQVGGTRLLRPTPPGPADAFGGRYARPRDLPPGADLSAVVDDPPGFPVFIGWDGFIGSFRRVEELTGAGQGGEVVAGVGQPVTAEEIAAAEAAERDPRDADSYALSVVKQGEGYVLRVGVDGWVRRLAEGDAEVAQVTRNVIDLVRRVNPRPRSPVG